VGILSSHRFLILLHPFPNRTRIRIRYPFPAARASDIPAGDGKIVNRVDG
jgi:hypothetical protein